MKTITLNKGIKANVFSPLDIPKFQAAWREAWGRLPLAARRAILKYWRGRHLCIELMDDRSDWSRGNSGSAIAQCGQLGQDLSFSTIMADQVPHSALVTVIAHELTHVVGYAKRWESHVDRRFRCMVEDDVNDKLEAWGFDVEEMDLALDSLCDHPDMKRIYSLT